MAERLRGGGACGCLVLGEGREFLVVFEHFVDEVFCFQGFFVLYGSVVFGVDYPAVLVVGVEILDGGFEDAAVVFNLVVERINTSVGAFVGAVRVFFAMKGSGDGDVPAGVIDVGAGGGDTGDYPGFFQTRPANADTVFDFIPNSEGMGGAAVAW